MKYYDIHGYKVKVCTQKEYREPPKNLQNHNDFVFIRDKDYEAYVAIHSTKHLEQLVKQLAIQRDEEAIITDKDW